jgi:hypothetical protein
MATDTHRDRKRPAATEAEQPAFQRKGWDEIFEPQEVSICQRCGRDVAFLVWRRPNWVCAVCADTV